MTYTHNDIIQAVCYTFGIKPEDLFGSMRSKDKKQNTDARNIAIWLMRLHTHLTLGCISALFGITYASASVATQKIRTQIKVYPDVREMYQRAEDNLINLKQHATNHANANQY